MLRKLGPCQILKKFGPNAYEIQLPPEIGISPIFNIANLTPFKAPTEEIDIGQIANTKDIQRLPSKKTPQLERILDTKVIKQTRGKESKQYLVKLKGYLDVDAMWMTKQDIKKQGTTL